jgi:hypothetical protein
MMMLGTFARADIELLIVGSKNKPVHFVLLPFTYKGGGLSPAVTVENNIIQALSSTGLFTMPYRYEKPANEENMMAWQLTGIRYVIQGEITEEGSMLWLRLTIADTLGLQPTISGVILNPEQLQLSTQMFADKVYRSLFYATFTNDTEKQYLDNENPTLTRYLNQLVMSFKNAWQSDEGEGICTVNIQQMPGGIPFTSRLQEDCFASKNFANRIQQAMSSVETLPYENYQDVFEKNLTVKFISKQ